jgi:CubicO group peptidase (beta-lactamase class C family)
MENKATGIFSGNTAVQLLLLLSILVVSPVIVSAQKSDFFISNGRKVDIRTFDEGIEKMLDETGIPGVSLAIIEDNKIVYTNVYGYKKSDKKEKINSNTVFEAASQSKSYLVYVAYKLVDAGLLDLDKPMYQYLPHELLEHDARYKLITPRMILGHSSGIENWRSYNQVDTLEIIYQPGSKYLYSGEGYNYLARVIESILHKNYDQYIEEMVIKPLEMKNAYVKFARDTTQDKLFPSDYAGGHDILGRYSGSWLNMESIPACANHNTANDYAKLIIAIFGQKQLSDHSLKAILQPMAITRMNNDHSAFYYGAGFEVIYSGGDTIIAQGGSNPGFKNQLYYSVVHKKGFIYMSNADRGRVIATRLSEMTVGLQLKPYFTSFHDEQYPSVSNSLLSVYREKDSLAMYEAIENLNQQHKLEEDVLNNLGEEFIYYDKEVAKRLLQQNQKLYPQSPRVYWLLGTLAMRSNEYESAYKHYNRARDLKYNLGQVADDLAKCRARLAEAARRKPLLVKIHGASANTVEAENFNAMNGVEVRGTTDGGGGQYVGYTDEGDWMDYRLNIATAGTYVIDFRVATMFEGSKLELRKGQDVLKTVDVPSTKGWDAWTTLRANVDLPAGEHVLRVYIKSGAFNMNWMHLTKATDSAKK